MSVLELAHHLAAVSGVPIEIHHEPARSGDVRDSQADASRLRQLFPEVDPVPIEVGLERTVSWFRDLPQHAEGVSFAVRGSSSR
jgi:UDP-glucose 4-epimerase